MPKDKERDPALADPSPRARWTLIAIGLQCGILPADSELVSALRGAADIPRVARDYLASRFEKKKKGRKHMKFLQQLLRDDAICSAFVKASEQIRAEDAARKVVPAVSRSSVQQRNPQARRILDRTSDLLWAEHKIALRAWAIKNIVHDKHRGIQSWVRGVG